MVEVVHRARHFLAFDRGAHQVVQSCDRDLALGAETEAHRALDAAVDRLYRKAPFESDRDRVERLFGLYEKLVNPLSDAARQNKRVARKKKLAPGSGPG